MPELWLRGHRPIRTQHGLSVNEGGWPGLGVFWGRCWGVRLRTRGWAFSVGPMFRGDFHVVRWRRGGVWVPAVERRWKRDARA
jgi:hypothetical protein